MKFDLIRISAVHDMSEIWKKKTIYVKNVKNIDFA